MGGQIVGFLSGEWKGVSGRPLNLMYIALAILIVAIAILAYSNTVDEKYSYIGLILKNIVYIRYCSI